MRTRKKKNPGERFTVGQIEKALCEADGRVRAVALALKTGRSTVYEYLLRYPELKAVQDDAAESALDEAEDKLMKLVRAENLTAIIFFLKTQGKKRGYVERSEHDLKSGDDPFEFTINIGNSIEGGTSHRASCQDVRRACPLRLP